MLVKTFLILFACLSIPPLAWAQEIHFYTHNVTQRAFLDATGELRGIRHTGQRAFNVELVRAMMHLMKHPVNTKAIPFRRGMHKIINEKNTALFNVIRTAQRENDMKWVGPLQRSLAAFYELKTAPTGIRILTDAKKVRGICVLNGNVHHDFLRKWGFTNLEPAGSYVACFKMLASGRVDLTPSSDVTLVERVKAAGVPLQSIVDTGVELFKLDGYIAFSKDIPDGIIAQWQMTLDQLKSSGIYQRLYREYMQQP